MTSKWSEWSPCAGVCGEKKKISRKRDLLHKPHSRHLLAKNCTQNLEQIKTCTVPCDQTENPKLKDTLIQASDRTRINGEKLMPLKTVESNIGEIAPTASETLSISSIDTGDSMTKSPVSIDSSPLTAASVPSFRQRLENYYRKYNPEKLTIVDEMLTKYDGREDVLFNSLVAKYGPEPVQVPG